LINFNLNNQIDDFNAAKNLLEIKDNDLSNLLSVQKDNYNNRFEQVELNNANLLEDLEDHIDIYNIKMAELDSINIIQDGRLTDLESRTGAIESDIEGRIESQINERVTIELFNQIESELRSTDSDLYAKLGEKIALSIQSDIDSTQNSTIALKLDKTVYDTKIGFLDSVNVTWEGRLRAIEEFARAMLATYTISKPDQTTYDFTGIVQQLNIAPYPVNVTQKLTDATTGDIGLRFQFTPYGYNTLLNKYQFIYHIDGVHQVKDIVLADIDSATLIFDFYLPDSSSLSYDIFAGSLIKLLNTSSETVMSVNITQTLLNTL